MDGARICLGQLDLTGQPQLRLTAMLSYAALNLFLAQTSEE